MGVAPGACITMRQAAASHLGVALIARPGMTRRRFPAPVFLCGRRSNSRAGVTVSLDGLVANEVLLGSWGYVRHPPEQCRPWSRQLARPCSCQFEQTTIRL